MVIIEQFYTIHTSESLKASSSPKGMDLDGGSRHRDDTKLQATLHTHVGAIAEHLWEKGLLYMSWCGDIHCTRKTMSTCGPGWEL